MNNKRIGTMKLKTLRKPGVSDISSMFDKLVGISEQHLTYADEAGLESLLALLNHDHPKVRTLAEVAVQSLDKVNKEIEMSTAGYNSMAEMLSYKNLQAQTDSLWTFATLAGNNVATHNDIVDAITWPTILRRAESNIPELQKVAVTLIANLSLSDDLQDLIVSDGLQYLKTLARTPDVKLQRPICNMFANLCANAQHIAPVVSDGGLQLIIGFLSSDDPELVSAALQTLANIANHAPMREQIVREGGLQPILGFLSSSNIMLVKGAAMAVSNLAKEPANHQPMIQAGTVESLVSLAKRCKVDQPLDARLASPHLTPPT
jgi:hypothetical protein